MPRFLQRLQESPLKRVPLDEVKRAYFSLYPEMLNSPDRQARLLQVLRDLEGQGHLSLPAAGSWDRLGSPPLPKWVSLTRERARTPTTDYSDVAWAPELGFWPELKAAQLADALAINTFLLRRRGALLAVPLKERSLEIFGDEKKLDAMRQSTTSLFSGRLPLSRLSTFIVPPPLPYRQADAPGKPVLVVENHNSFWSFGEWNQTARRYSAVVYGSGAAFRSAGLGLTQVLLEVHGRGAEYLGDLDPKGVEIPLEFNRCVEAGGAGGVVVRPALEYYAWLLDCGVTREKPECAGAASDGRAQHWLGDALGARLTALWEQGRWTPQEALGFEQLRALPA